MAVEAAIEALRATLDLVSQTKMGQLFKLSDLLSPLQVLRGFLFIFLPNALCSDTKNKNKHTQKKYMTFLQKNFFLGGFC